MANLLEFRTFFSNFKSLLLRQFSTDGLEIGHVVSGKAACQSYKTIFLISLTVLEIFRLIFQKTQFFTLKIQDGRRNYGEKGYFENRHRYQQYRNVIFTSSLSTSYIFNFQAIC